MAEPTPETPKRRGRPPLGPEVPATYPAFHKRLNRLRGPASAHLCVGCGAQAAQWSYRHDDPDEVLDLVPPSGMVILEGIDLFQVAYSLKPDHYDPMCRSCHYVRDNGVERGGVRRLRSGRFQARISMRGKRVSAPTTFATREEAQEWVETARSSLDLGS